MMLLEEMASILITPYLLIFVVPKVHLGAFLLRESDIGPCYSLLSNYLCYDVTEG